MLLPDAANELFFSCASTVILPAVFAAVRYKKIRGRSCRPQRSIRIATPRERTSVSEIFNSMGERMFRRAFRMTFDAFWRLHSILLPHLLTAISINRNYVRKGGREGGNYSLPPTPNGPISPSIRLGAALRYFAGGSPYDIVLAFGISYSEMMTSVWIVVDAINKCPQLKISYPGTLEEQRKIAAGFEAASEPGIRNCAGAIDGILIWMLKPSLKEAEKCGVDQKKFLCGRKHKFGLNCQAVSDCRGRILDISIKNGGSASDCVAFEASDLYKRLENGLMHQDGDNRRFVLFGDNAYLNTSYMATPFTNVSGDPNRAVEDNYNFYHSQLRIRVECAFGMLVQRWGILRMAMPRNLSVAKVVAIVIALAKLHNFCIGESNIAERIPQTFYRDRFHMMNAEGGYVTLRNGDPQVNNTVPTELMHGGEHFNEMTREQRRQVETSHSGLPRQSLCQFIADGHWQRPTRRGSRHSR